MSEESTKQGEGEGRSRWWIWLLKAALAALVVIVVGSTLTWLWVRTPAVMAHLVGPVVEEQAQQRDVELRVGAMRGAGLRGLRLYDVDGAVLDGEYRISGAAETVDMTVDIGASLSARRPVIDAITVDSVELEVGRHGGDIEEQSVDVADVASWGAGDGVQAWFSDELALEVGEFAVGLSGFGTVADMKTLQFSDVGAVVDTNTGGLVDLFGNGEISEVAMAIGADDESVYADIDDSDLQDRLAALPFEVGVERVSVPYSEIERALEIRDFDGLELRLHELVVTGDDGTLPTIKSKLSNLSSVGGAIRWDAPQAQLEGDGRTYQLGEPEFAYRRDAPGFSFYTQVEDGEGGSVELEGMWHLPTSLVAVNAWIRDFHWDGTIPGAHRGSSPVDSVRVDGTFHGDVDLIHRLVSVDGDARLRELTLDVPVVSGEPLTFERVDVGLPVTVDLGSGAVSVVGGSIEFPDVTPFELRGRIVDAGAQSYAFEFDAVGRDIDADTLVERLPTELTGVISETELRGQFGVGVHASGHSAFPESLMLEVDLSGDVDVTQDLEWGTTDSMDSDEVRLIETAASSNRPTVQGEWTVLSELPEHLPASILAAEDTSFFEHDGLDWSGLEMAMEDNLEEGRLARGGSTITQQVAKNLFLDHERTLSRKLQEAFLTWRIEETSTKEEILELYLNVVEWGPDVQGLFAASHYFFDRRPEELEHLEGVLLASILPNPIQFGGAVQQGYLPSSREDKMRRVLENLRFLEELDFQQYFAAVEELDEGRIGSLNFEPCADDDTAPEGAKPCSELEVEDRDGEELTFEAWEVEESIDDTGWAPLTH